MSLFRNPVRPALLAATILCIAPLALAKTQTMKLDVPTMDCATCPITIKAALNKVPGVTSARVSYERREALVVYDDTKTGPDALKKATADAGYPSFVKVIAK